jgi:RNA polymerase sigma factor (sigma-70 family)
VERLTEDQKKIAEESIGVAKMWTKRAAKGVPGVTKDDVYSAACFGVIDAASRCDFAMGPKAFYSYCKSYVRHHVKAAYYDRHVVNISGALRHGVDTFSEDRARLLRIAKSKSRGIDKLEVFCTRPWNPFDGPDKEKVNNALARLDSRTREALVRTVVMEETLQAVGKDMGIGKERVRQLRNRAIEKMRGYLGSYEECA